MDLPTRCFPAAPRSMPGRRAAYDQCEAHHPQDGDGDGVGKEERAAVPAKSVNFAISPPPSVRFLRGLVAPAGILPEG